VLSDGSPSIPVTFEPLAGSIFACLVCAFITIAARPKAAPWKLQAVKAVTLTAVTGCFAVAASGYSQRGEPENPVRFVLLVALLCVLPQMLMVGPAATMRSVPLVLLVYVAAALSFEAGRQAFWSHCVPRTILLCAAAW